MSEMFVQRDKKDKKPTAVEATNSFPRCDLYLEVGDEVPEPLTYSAQGNNGQFVNVINGTFECITKAPKYPSLDTAPAE